MKSVGYWKEFLPGKSSFGRSEGLFRGSRVLKGETWIEGLNDRMYCGAGLKE